MFVVLQRVVCHFNGLTINDCIDNHACNDQDTKQGAGSEGGETHLDSFILSLNVSRVPETRRRAITTKDIAFFEASGLMDLLYDIPLASLLRAWPQQAAREAWLDMKDGSLSGYERPLATKWTVVKKDEFSFARFVAMDAVFASLLQSKTLFRQAQQQHLAGYVDTETETETKEENKEEMKKKDILILHGSFVNTASSRGVQLLSQLLYVTSLLYEHIVFLVPPEEADNLTLSTVVQCFSGVKLLAQNEKWTIECGAYCYTFDSGTVEVLHVPSAMNKMIPLTPPPSTIVDLQKPTFVGQTGCLWQALQHVDVADKQKEGKICVIC